MSVISDKPSLTKKSLSCLPFIGILLIASNLRAPITALGPVINEIAVSLSLSGTLTGLLNALPLMIFALASPFAPVLTRKIGLERSLLIALALITAGCLVRPFSGNTGLWTGTLAIGLGIAFANVLVVPLIKRDFLSNAARCIGLYAATMALTAALSSGIAAPLSEISRAAWKISIGVWVIPAALALIVWWAVCSCAINPTGHAEKSDAKGGSSVWKSSIAWQVSMFMALHTMVFYTLIDWYPSMANEHGVSASAAGFHLFIYQAVAVMANLSTSIFITRMKDQRLLGLICSLFITAGIAGLLLMPQFSALWLIFAGIGAGMSMVTCLALFGLRTKGHTQAGQLSGKAQCIGYLIGALGPCLAGIVHSHTHDWDFTLKYMLLISFAQAYFAWQAGRDRFI
ncbi:MFS transporter [Pantoea agglomerans]|uniref:CynX/NimT family MFS transporter n=1 Tax=Enterobacter agglomerans TaxID=549 RepID=UPI002B1E7E3F|nr:MFS transporter [Pantoea agglomerans]